MKACNDGTIIVTTTDYSSGVVTLRVYNSNDDFKIVQDLVIPKKKKLYTLLVIDDCETVILTPYYGPPDSIYLVHKNELGMFELTSTYSPPP